MVVREDYLKQLRSFKHKELIKVITGIRRCGKSTLMRQYQQELLNLGVKQEQIIHINFEDLDYEHLLNYNTLYNHLKQNLYKGGYTYIFLDEVQKVDNFQKVVDSLYIKENVDIYITGSNSDLLSSELASLLTGRYVEIKMFPLSFSEYCSNFKDIDVKTLFNNYLTYGSFPYSTNLVDKQSNDIYLNGLFNTIFMVDVAKRYPATDMGVLESILRFLYHNIGSLVSSTSIANTLTSNNRKSTYNTVEKYIKYLKECFLIYEAQRYDIKGKQHLKSLSKYYVVDNGLRNLLLSNQSTNIGHILENLVYLELLRRGYKVSVGKIDEKEVDFVAINQNGIEYYQVSATVLDPNKLKTELLSLQKINDNYPKYLITLDDFNFGQYDGIKIVNAINFLLNK